ncbi:hypothetical protein LSH36_436g04021, partial [Paralvinella palmiformis]
DVIEEPYIVSLVTLKPIIQILQFEEKLRHVIATVINNYCVLFTVRCCSVMPFKSGVSYFHPLISSQHVSLAGGYPRGVGNDGQNEIGIVVRAPLKLFFAACNGDNTAAKMRPYRQVSGSTDFSQDKMSAELYTDPDTRIYLDGNLLHLIIQERLDDINRE